MSLEIRLGKQRARYSPARICFAMMHDQEKIVVATQSDPYERFEEYKAFCEEASGILARRMLDRGVRDYRLTDITSARVRWYPLEAMERAAFYWTLQRKLR